MADDSNGGPLGPVAPLLGGNNQFSLNALVSTLQQNGRTLNAILDAIQALPGTLAPVYAVGTWTPVLKFGGATTGPITYSTQVGTWTQTGREYVFYFDIALTSKGSAAGAATITGLPVASSLSLANDGAGGLITSYANMAGLAGVPLLNVGASSNVAALLSAGAAASTALLDTAFTNTSTLAGVLRLFT